MSDEKPPMPKQPTTAQLPAVPEWAVELTKSVKEGIAEVRADIGLVSNDLGVLKGRVSNLEESRRADEQRTAAHSIKVRSISESDLAQDAELAKERTARESLAVRVVAIEDKVGTIYKLTTGVLANPKVLAVGRVLFLLLAGYAAQKGVRLLP